MPRSLALTALALAVALVITQARVVIGGDTWDDVAYQTEIAPPRLAAATQIARADVPAWWDGTGFGVPLLAEPAHGALAPTTWIARTPRALDALLVLHLWWAALGVAAWARRRGASELAGLGAGLLVATSGILASAAIRGALPALAQLPWLGVSASALAAAADRPARARAALGIGAALGAIALAGQLAIAVDALVLVVALAAARATWRWLAAGVAAGLAIGAAQWWPAALQLPHEVGARVDGLPLARLVELIAPGRFGDATAWFPSLFAGAGVFALARLARRDVIAVAAFGALAMIAGRGGWPAWAGAPELHVASLVVVIAACAASGLDAALEGDGRAARALAIGAALTAAATVAVAHAHDAPAGRDGAVAVAGLALAAALAWKPRGGWAAPVVLALVVGPSVSAIPDVAPTTSRAPLESPPAWASAARSAAPSVETPIRVFRPQPFELTAGVHVLGLDDAAATLAGESAAPWDLALAHGGDPARDPGEEQVWRASAAEGGALLDRFGVGIAILPTSTVGPRGFHAIGDRGAYSLVQLPVAPLAAVMHGWRWTIAPRDALALLFPPGGGLALPRGTVVLRGRGDARTDPRPPDPCGIPAWRDGDITLACDAGAAPAYAAVSSAPADGWSVTVDGEPAEDVTADVLRRAVAIAPGAHRIHWSYRAPGLAPGAALAGAGLLGLLALGWAARRRAGISSPS